MIALLFFCIISSLQPYLLIAYIYPIRKHLQRGDPITFNEGHLFAQNAGPPLLNNGLSFIEFNVDITLYTKGNLVSSIFQLLTYRTNDAHIKDIPNGLCKGDWRNINASNNWLWNVEFTEYKSNFSTDSKGIYSDNYLGFTNTTFYKHVVNIRKKVYISREGWYNVLLALCNLEYHPNVMIFIPTGKKTPPPPSTEKKKKNSVDSFYVRVDGEVTFKNPYGYLKAEDYGFLPFEAARLLAYVLIVLWYMSVYSKNRESILNIHTALLIVIFLAFLESLFWTITYFTLNTTGEPFCCPYAPLVITSFVLQVIRQTFARTLLLVISLGYGIVRPKLLNFEWTFIFLLTILYFFAALAQQIYNIIMSAKDSTTHSTCQGDASCEKIQKYLFIPEYVIDIIFFSWIYFSITSTIRILTQFRQTEKLLLFKSLIFIIGIFIIFFAVIAILLILDAQKIILWSWKYNWLKQVIWELLNVILLLAVAIATRPNETSQAVVYSSQLPTEEPTGELEMTSHGFVDHADDYDNDSDHDNGNDEVQFLNNNEYDMVGSSLYRPNNFFGEPNGKYKPLRRNLSKSSSNGHSSHSSGGASGGGGGGASNYSSLPVSHDEEYGIDED